MKYRIGVTFRALVPAEALDRADIQDRRYCAAVYFRTIFKASFPPMGWVIADYQEVVVGGTAVSPPLYQLWGSLRRTLVRVTR